MSRFPFFVDAPTGIDFRNRELVPTRFYDYCSQSVMAATRGSPDFGLHFTVGGPNP